MIYPQSSDYKKNNYDLRISVATVNLESTVFTSLPGVKRILTVLEGELTLVHEGQHEAVLQAYQQDYFQGDWTKRSTGKVRDFNVIWKAGNTSVEHKLYAANSVFSLEAKNQLNFCLLARGSFISNNETINTNDTVVMSGSLAIKTIEQCEVLHVSFDY